MAREVFINGMQYTEDGEEEFFIQGMQYNEDQATAVIGEDEIQAAMQKFQYERPEPFGIVSY